MWNIWRRTRQQGSAGYVHFWLSDLVPQIGCGVLDADRVPKGGYAALKLASQPLHAALEHDGRQTIALWVFNDTPQRYDGLRLTWQVTDPQGRALESGETPVDVGANGVQRVIDARWTIPPAQCARVELALVAADGETLVTNAYDYPLQPTPRPKGYPWNFDPYLGFKVFDRPGAVSLVDQGSSGIIKMIPLSVRETLAEMGMRQKFPLWLLSAIAKLTRPFVNPPGPKAQG
jgi:hypothetical protein